jgi:conjugal transfer pilus assembly protein TraB
MNNWGKKSDSGWLSSIVGNWKRDSGKNKINNQFSQKEDEDDSALVDDSTDTGISSENGGGNDPLDMLSTLDEKSSALRKKTISRIGYVLGFLSVGFFIIQGLYTFTQRYEWNEQRAPIETTTEEIGLEVTQFASWQLLKDQEIESVENRIDIVEQNLTDRINATKESIQNELNSTKTILSEQIATAQVENNSALKSLLDNISAQIEKSARESKIDVGRRMNTIEDKIAKSKKLLQEQIDKSKRDDKIDFSKISMPKLPPLNFKEDPNAKTSDTEDKNNSATKSTTLEKPEEDPVLVSVAIGEVKSIELSTLKEKVEGDEEGKEDDIPTFTVMTGFTKGTIITGADVPTLTQNNKDPIPVYISIDGDMINANNYTSNIDNCLLTAAAIGDFASGVAQLRISDISCIATDDVGKSYKLTGTIKAWAYDENGKFGIKGRLVSKEGEIIAKGLPLATIEGMIAMLNNSSIGGEATEGAAGIANALGGSAQSTTSQIMGKFSDYYLKILESLNPTIEVKAGREIVIGFKGGDSLKFEEFTPVDSNYFENNTGAFNE